MAQLGDGAGSGYPQTIDTRQVWENAPAAAPDSSRRIDSECVNDLATAIVALENTLGANPQGLFGSVAARLNQLLGGTGGTAGVYTFTDATAFTIPGTVHNVGQGALIYKLYNAQIPAHTMEAGSYTVTVSQSTYDVDLAFVTPTSGYVALGATSPSYIRTFTAQTTVTILGTAHLLGTSDLTYKIYDNADPANEIQAGGFTVHPTTHDVVVTFTPAQSGFIVLSAGGPTYAVDFTSTQVVTISGGTHQLGTRGLLFNVYDNATPRNAMGDPATTVHPNTFDVVMDFGTPLSGRIVLQPATTLTGRDFRITDAGIVGQSAVQVASGFGNLYLVAGGGNHIYLMDKVATPRMVLQTLNGFLGLGVYEPTHQLELSTNDAVKPVSPDWLVLSDERLKDILRPFAEGLDLLRQLEPCWYRYNGKGGIARSREDHVGLSAQALQRLAPYMVRTYRARLSPEEGEADLLTVDGNAFTYLLINAVKELHAMVAPLQAQVASLRDQVTQLQHLVATLATPPPDALPEEAQP